MTVRSPFKGVCREAGDAARVGGRRCGGGRAPALWLLGLFLVSIVACAHGPSRKERESAEIQHNLGTEALRAGRSQDALKAYDEALALDETFVEAHLGRGLVMEFGFGRLEDAEREYRRAIALRSNFSEAHNNLGQLLAKTGRLPEAVKEFDLALGNMLYAEPYVAHCNKGEALHRQGKKEEGIAELKACLANNARYCQGHRQLGGIQLAAGRTKDALDSFGAYAKYCDKAPDAQYQLGLAFLKAGQVERAREAFQRCESLAGDGGLAPECKRRREMLQ